MSTDLKTVNEIIRKKDLLGDIIGEIVSLRKEENKYFSLQYICNQAGISSKGHLGDVIKGRRTLKLDYVKPLCKVLKLDSKQSRVFKLLAEKEKSRKPFEIESLEIKISRAKKRLKIHETYLDEDQINPVQLCRVICSFGLTGQIATKTEIEKLIRIPSEELDHIIQYLFQRNWLELNSEGKLKLLNTNIHFNQGFNDRLLEAYLDFAKSNIDKKKSSEESYFEASTISVSKYRYKQVLRNLREYVEDQIAFMETEDAEQLVHISLQIFPD